ncbi:MAG: hypothetical protein ACJ76N_22110 [Thermoanaerobaculia bacterium]
MKIDDRLARDYQEAASYFRVLADARLKLLALVPLLAGAAISLLPKMASWSVVLPLSILGFFVTLGILIYDLRNTQIYDNLLRRLKALEAAMGFPAFTSSQHRFGGAFLDRPPRKWRLCGLLIWHDIGLVIIYSAALGAWSYLFFYTILSTILIDSAALLASVGLGTCVAAALIVVLKGFGLPIDAENDAIIDQAREIIDTLRESEERMHNTVEVPTFRVGDVFPSGDDKRVSLVRFLTGAHSLAAMARILPVLPKSPAYRETKNYLMLLSLGAAHEAANAFWGAYQHGVFAALSSLGWSEIDECISRLIVDCDRQRPDSLQSRLVSHSRNKFSFHWDMEEVQKSLSQVADEVLPAWTGGEDETFMTVALPIVERVTLKGLEIKAGSEHDLQELMGRVARFQGDLFRVAEAAYNVALKETLEQNGSSGGTETGA